MCTPIESFSLMRMIYSYRYLTYYIYSSRSNNYRSINFNKIVTAFSALVLTICTSHNTIIIMKVFLMQLTNQSNKGMYPAVGTSGIANEVSVEDVMSRAAVV